MMQITYESETDLRAGKKPDVREQAIKKGISSLTDKELIMILLGTGIKGVPVGELSDEVLNVLDNYNTSEIHEQLSLIPGMGPGKTTLVLAALELGRRITAKNSLRVKKPTDIVPFIQSYALKQEEHFLCITLDSSHDIKKLHEISKGILNKSLIHPREIFADAITDRAAAIILAHNHPSGIALPSGADAEVTQMILDASKIIGITLLDHIIVTKTGYFSFREKTDIFENRNSDKKSHLY
ncbi:MAG: DNA repair protein RadC [Treponemataceae bacterium]|nr:DNA repair protein RadC [Treponemataceae bacterium]